MGQAPSEETSCHKLKGIDVDQCVFHFMVLKISSVLPTEIVVQIARMAWETSNSNKITSLACGYYHSMILTTNGVFTSGLNSDGQLGLGHTTTTPMFTKVKDLPGRPILGACGHYHCLVLTTSGLFGWGQNSRGQLGLSEPSELLKPTPIPIPCHDLESIISISCGSAHSLILTSNGLVFAAGANLSGQLGLGNQQWSTSIPHFTQVPLAMVSQIACGEDHSLAISPLGVHAWGSNKRYQLGTDTLAPILFSPTLVPRLQNLEITKIACGNYHSAAATKSACYLWGDNANGQSGIGSPEMSVSEPCVTLDFQGKAGSLEITQLSCGGAFGMVLTNIGNGASVGRNIYGQLGDLTTDQRRAPVKIKCSNISMISCGGRHSIFAVKGQGLLVCGANSNGQLGLPYQDALSIPTPVTGFIA